MKLITIEECGSTMEVARLQVEEGGYKPPFAVRAERQTGGRGRMGNQWQESEGALFLTIVLGVKRPPEAFSLFIAVCISKVLETYKVPLSLKWPNDLVAPQTHAKYGGILIECDAPKKPLYVGVGINIFSAPADQPNAIALGAFVDPPIAPTLATEICNQIEKDLVIYETEGFAPFFAEYDKRLCWKGEQISWKGAEQTESGMLQGVAEDGALLVQVQGRSEKDSATDETILRKIYAGEISAVRVQK